jgi:CheY-like chemotaxis protein
MPEMDGLEATREILARIPQAERPWIVAMTANAMDSDRQQCLDAGMNAYIAKPIGSRSSSPPYSPRPSLLRRRDMRAAQPRCALNLGPRAPFSREAVGNLRS